MAFSEYPMAMGGSQKEKPYRQTLICLSLNKFFPTEISPEHVRAHMHTYCRYKELLNILLQQLGLYKSTFHKVFMVS